jgi:hypothetical protein
MTETCLEADYMLGEFLNVISRPEEQARIGKYLPYVKRARKGG